MRVSGRNFVFEVIAPSLPGYGFSDAAVRPGLHQAQIAQIFNTLMKRLKFDRFYAQGGKPHPEGQLTQGEN